MALNLALSAVALALSAPYLYGRGQVLSLFYKNAPGRLAEARLPGASFEVKFADRVRSCEDAIFLEDQGLAIMGCDPGRERHNTVMGVFRGDPVPPAELYVYDYKDASLPDAEALRQLEIVGYDAGIDMHTLGMTYDAESSTLFVTNHRREGGPTIDLFTLDLEALTATHKRTLKHPLINGPNSMVLAPDTKDALYVTNDHKYLMKDNRMMSQLETYLALPLGTVVYVDFSVPEPSPSEEDDAEDSSEEEVEEPEVKAEVIMSLPYANGITFLNSTTAAVASTSDASVFLYEVMGSSFVGGGVPVWTYKTKIPVPFLPDNLDFTSEGSLLIAGHPHVPSLMKFAATRYVCNGEPDVFNAADEEVKKYCADKGLSTTGSWAVEWKEGQEELKTLYSGVEYPSSATAARDDERGVGIVAGLYAKGILVWREQKE